MVMTLDIPDHVVKRAELMGVSVSELVSQTIGQMDGEPLPSGFVPLGVPKHTPEEATAIIREIASKHTLGGLNIKDLINEGRRI